MKRKQVKKWLVMIKKKQKIIQWKEDQKHNVLQMKNHDDKKQRKMLRPAVETLKPARLPC